MSDDNWPTMQDYSAIREAVAIHGWSDEIQWSEGVTRPATAEAMAGELIWVIINSGMSHKVTRGIQARVNANLAAGIPVFPTAFKHPGKAAAIDLIWQTRADLFQQLTVLTDEAMIDWCGEIPWIGSITKYHAAKNLGADVAKPDRWLERIAAVSGETVQDMCVRLATCSGDRIATVDLVLWRAAATGLINIPTASQPLIETHEGRKP